MKQLNEILGDANPDSPLNADQSSITGNSDPYLKGNIGSIVPQSFDSDKNFLSGSGYGNEGGDSGFKEIAQDIINPILHPSLLLDNARAGALHAASGFNRMMADEALAKPSPFRTDTEAVDYAKEQRAIADSKTDYAKLLETEMDKVYKPKTKLGTLLKGVTGSSPSMMAGLAASFVGGPMAGYLVGIGGGSATAYGQKYEERSLTGDAPETKERAALIHGVAEGASELIGLQSFVNLFKAAKAGAKLTPLVVREIVAEGASEVTAGIPQGIEDAWRGKGKDPAGLPGIKEHFTSGQFVQDAVDNFVGGAMMGAGVGFAMKPVQMQYRPAALKQAAAMTLAIQDAQAAGRSTVTIGGQEIHIDKLNEKLGELTESFDLKPKDIETSVKGIEAEVSVENTDQAIEANSIQGIKDFLNPTPATHVEETLPPPSAGISSDAIAPDSGSEIATDQATASDPSVASSDAIAPDQASLASSAVDQTIDGAANMDSRSWLEENRSSLPTDLSITQNVNGKEVAMPIGKAIELTEGKLSKFEELLRCLNL